MNAARAIFACVVLWQFAAVARAASAADQEARLRDALAAFDSAVSIKSHSGPEAQRLYRQALDGFTSLIADGVRSSALYYNVGNTYLRLGDVGHAIVHYRRALRLDPGNEKVRKNLQAARNMCESQFSKRAASAFIETLLFWHYGTPSVTRLRVCLAGYVLFWGVMLARLFVSQRVAALTWMAVLLGGLGLIAGVSVGWDKVTAANRLEGVVSADKAVIRKGNGDYYDPQFDRPLAQGVEFRVLDERQDVKAAPWYHIELPDGKDGWLRADQVEII